MKTGTLNKIILFLTLISGISCEKEIPDYGLVQLMGEFNNQIVAVTNISKKGAFGVARFVKDSTSCNAPIVNAEISVKNVDGSYTNLQILIPFNKGKYELFSPLDNIGYIKNRCLNDKVASICNIWYDDSYKILDIETQQKYYIEVMEADIKSKKLTAFFSAKYVGRRGNYEAIYNSCKLSIVAR